MKRHASLNRIYRLVWNQALSAWVAVAECARGRGKSSARRKLIVNAAAATAALALAISPYAQAGPTDGQVVAGSGSISQAGHATTINQTSQNLAINWSDFSVAAHEAVRFNQPNASSIVLNRVLGQSISQIRGAISANGQVFILNPNGVIFGAGAQVDVGGLVASTLSLSNDDFMANRFSFSNNGESGSVINQGTLTAAQNGYIAMLAPQVINEGVISATLGSAVLAAGNQVTLNLSQGSLVGFSIDRGAFQALVDNKQLIEADGGQVFVSAKAAAAITTAMVNNSGIVEARTLGMVNGRIEMISDMAVGTTHVGGKLDASAPNGGDGGFIETSGAHVKIADDAHITTAAPSGNTGSWLIDPFNFTVAASGGDITGTALGNLLASNSITIQTADTPSGDLSGNTGSDGDIFINAAVSWNAPTTLTLDAYRHIEINQAITASDAEGTLVLKYGQGASGGVINGTAASYRINAPVNLQAGENFSTQLGSAGTVKNYYVITDLGSWDSDVAEDLQGIRDNVNRHFALGANIDATATSSWNTNAGFEPLGNSSGQFTGDFEGLGHTITGLTINRPTTDYVGLFGAAAGNSISNVSLVNAAITGQNRVGALVGAMENGSISNSSASGTVQGGMDVGGLVGRSYDSAISLSHASSAVEAVERVGGLLGSQYGSGSGASIVDASYASGNVDGNYHVGGLVGYNQGSTATITFSHASGDVASDNAGGYASVGGLVGSNDYGGVYNSYATGNVISVANLNATYGSNKVGGLVGYNYQGGIENSYATGRVISTLNLSYNATAPNMNGVNKVGGLVGVNFGGQVLNSHATGNVRGNFNFTINSAANVDYVYGTNKVGGLVGDGFYGVTDTSYATGAVSANTTIWNYGQVNTDFTVGSFVGGLQGNHNGDYGGVLNSHASGVVSHDFTFNSDTIHTPQYFIKSAGGGLLGRLDSGEVYNSYASGSVWIDGSNFQFDTMQAGGLIGLNENGEISHSHATGNVISRFGYGELGGLVGRNEYYGTISQSYAVGNVTISGYGYGYGGGRMEAGGLVGRNYGSISQSYSIGRVTSNGLAGGLVAFNEGSIDNSYATGLITSEGDAGGLIGENQGTVSNSFWDTDTTGFAAGYGIGWDNGTWADGTPQAGVTGLSSTDFLLQNSFTSLLDDENNPYWTFGNSPNSGTWFMIDGETRPFLQSEYSTRITNSHQLQLMAMDLNASYIVANNIDMSAEFNNVSGLWATDAYASAGRGFVPLGTFVERFTGSLDGNAHSISDLNINRSALTGVGLFGYGAGDVSNLNLLNVNITGATNVGGLAGVNHGNITNSLVTGTLVGGGLVGGMVGYNQISGSIQDSSADVNVQSSGSIGGIGGLVGSNYGVIENSHAAGGVIGISQVGGLVGRNANEISQSYATASVSGTSSIGGLAGKNFGNGDINQSYASGAVTGSDYVGGLVGLNQGEISASYALGNVVANNLVGGLVGYNDGGSITQTYATGSVAGDSYLGGLVGVNENGTVSASFWDADTTGQLISAGLEASYGKTTAELLTESTYISENWSFSSGSDSWFMIDGETRPFLQSEYSTTITNSHQLQLMAMDLTANYTLANNINMAAEFNNLSGMWATETGTSTGRGFVPVGNENSQFTGSFNGQNHTISGLTINRPTLDGVGLFGYGQSISNVGLLNVAITGEDYVGGLAGNNYGSVANSYVTGTVTGDDSVGGLVGWTSNNSSIVNSYSAATVVGGNEVGGLVGYHYGNLANTYAIGTVTGLDNVGGLVGLNEGSISKSYASAAVHGSEDVGGLVGFNDGMVSSSFWDTETSGQIYSAGGADQNTAELLTQSTYTDAGWSFGSSPNSGTWFMIDGETRPFLQSEYSTTITNSHQLQLMAMDLNASYTLANNIDMSADFTNVSGMWATNRGAQSPVGKGFVPVGGENNQFTGSFDGQNHTIAGLTINRADSYGVGLFGYADANISNIGLVGVSIAGGSYSYGVGGLVGHNFSHISNSYVTGSVSGDSDVGGLVGFNNYGSISNSYATANVTGTGDDIGGLVGDSYGGLFVNTYATGNVSGMASVGGLIGENENGSISNSYASGNVTGTDYGTGGLVGFNYGGGTIRDSYAVGNVSGMASVGGLIGENENSSISISYAAGNVTGEDSVGGLAGTNSFANLAQTYATGNVSAIKRILVSEQSDGLDESLRVGGLVGNNYMSDISESYATGSVFGSLSVNLNANVNLNGGNVYLYTNVGGLVGVNNGIVNQSYATGAVSGITSFVGNNYNVAGNVNIYSASGGLVGLNGSDKLGDIDQSYATGYVENNTSYSISGVIAGSFVNEPVQGGLVGQNDGGTVTFSFWDIDTTGQLISAGSDASYGKTTAELLMQSTYTDAGWDFTVDINNPNNAGTWFMIDGETRPFLQSEYSTSITNSHQLQLMAMDLTADYTLANNINMSAEFNNISGMWATETGTSTGRGFVPVGNENSQFTGSFNGLNHSISGLTINRTDSAEDVGLFGGANASISNVGLVGVNVTGGYGSYGVGGLVGYNYGQISNSFVSGAVNGENNVGGLLGFNNNGSISGSYSTATVTGTGDDIGGLVGDSEGGRFTNTYATGNVTGIDSVGGLIGENENGIVLNSYATGSVIGDEDVGGLVGYNYDGSSISNVYATGSITGTDATGGLVGKNQFASIAESYASGFVSGHYRAGGLVGQNRDGGTISNSQARGNVNGYYGVGGLVGANQEVLTAYSGGVIDSDSSTSRISNSYATGNVVGTNSVGGLVGLNDSEISINFLENVTISNSTRTADIRNSYATGTVHGDENVGGLVGLNRSTLAVTGSSGSSITSSQSVASINKSYATGAVTITSSGRVGGLLGVNQNSNNTNTNGNASSASVDQSYATGSVSGDALLAGGLIGQNDGGTVTSSFWDIDTTGQLISAGSDAGYGKTTAQLLMQSTYTDAGWDFTVDINTPNNAGSWFMMDGETRPFLQSEYSTTITNSHQLQLMAMDLTADYTLANNINMAAEFNNLSGMWATNTGTSAGRGFVPVGAYGYGNSSQFTGSFNGLNHTISGLTINRPEWGDVGLFGRANAYISKLGLINVSVTGGYGNSGGLVGYNYGRISHSYVTGSVAGDGDVGGLVGFNDYGSIRNSYASATVTGSGDDVGGLVGDSEGGRFTNTYATGNVTGIDSVGGLIGENENGIVLNSYATGSVIGEDDVGGLVGYNYDGGSITNSHATGNVLGNSSVGGLVGKNEYASITSSYALGSVAGSLSYGDSVGGLVGYNYDGSAISNSYADGMVSGSNSVGGLVGWNAGSISNSHAKGLVFGREDQVGGLVGENLGDISTSYASGLVLGSGKVGGLAGSNAAEITNSYASGSVVGVDKVGGLVGYNANNDSDVNANINNSYAIGNVTGSSAVGGLVGANYGTVSITYATGQVAGGVDVGGLIGVNEGEATNSVWDRETSGQNQAIGWNGGDTANLVSLTTPDFLLQDNFTSVVDDDSNPYWSFGASPNSGTWFMVDGETRPFLQSEYSTSITNSHQLQLMAMDLNAHYTLVNSIDMTPEFTNLSGMWATDRSGAIGKGFVKIGNDEGSMFNGEFDGLGHTINGLYINRPLESDVAMFGYGNANISNVGLVNVSVTGNTFVAGLVADNYGNINNSYVTGSVTGSGGFVGGMVSANSGGISNSYADVMVSAGATLVDSDSTSSAGGLVGKNREGGSISRSYALGNVTASGNDVGGLVGHNWSNIAISNSHASGNVLSTGNSVGGLVGFSENNTSIENSYATGNVSGDAHLGGLVGHINYGGISNSYATGNVTSSTDGDLVGGLLGYSQAEVNQTYAKGTVTSSGNDVGGLVGQNDGGSIANSYWNNTVNSNVDLDNGNGIGLSSSQMRSSTNFVGFNFTATPGASGNNWVLVNADGTLNNTGDAAGATTPMLASEYATSIGNAHQLQLMAMDLNADYTLVKDVDANKTAGLSDVWTDGGGFMPVGYEDNHYTGSFDGQNHTISGLTINRPTLDGVGLFGYGQSISNVGLLNVAITGEDYVGGLAGNNYGSVANSYVTGTVTGDDSVGGLVGWTSDNGSIINSYSAATVVGDYEVGGLVGYHSGSLANSYASGSVSGTNNVGGLVGHNDTASIANSYATGNVSAVNEMIIQSQQASVEANLYAGGLVGFNDGGSISNSYAKGSVDGSLSITLNASVSDGNGNGDVLGNNYVGGLVGFNDNGNINNSYATGATTGSTDFISNEYDVENELAIYTATGGLVGLIVNDSLVVQSYATGNVINNFSSDDISHITGTPNNNVGGLVGSSEGGTVTASYWDTETTGQSTSDGGVGKNSADLLMQSSYIDWSFGSSPNSGTWFMIEGETRPFLQSEYSTSINNSHQLQLMAMDLTANYTLANNLDMTVDFSNSSGMWATNRLAMAPTGTGFVPIGNENDSFTGRFDGQGHTITGFTVYRDANYGGLFGYNEGMVSHVGMVDVDVSGANNVGGLVGVNDGLVDDSYVTGMVSGGAWVGGLVGTNGNNNMGAINDSHAIAEVSAGQTDGSSKVGGLVGSNYGNIAGSYADGEVVGDSGSRKLGGLVGSNGGSISRSYANNNVSGDDNVGGLIGLNYGDVNSSFANGMVRAQESAGGLVGSNYGEINNSYAAAFDVVATQDVGGLVGYNRGMLNNSFYDAENTQINGETFNSISGILTVGGLYSTQYGDWMRHNKTLNAEDYFTADSDGVLEIGTLQQFKDLLGFSQNENLSFIQTENIDLQDDAGLFMPYFAGLYHGNDYSLENAHIDVASNSNIAVFGELHGSLTDVHATNVYVNGGRNVGGLVGLAAYDSAIQISSVNGVVAGYGGNVGGVAGSNYGYINAAQADVTVSGGVQANNVGGLVGVNYGPGNISQSYANGDVSASTNGIEGGNVGGLVGLNYGVISSVNAYGNVIASSQVGGLVGANFGEISYGDAYGDVMGTYDYVGGLVGLNSVNSNYNTNASISSSGAYGSVNGRDYVGGLIGANIAKFEQYYGEASNVVRIASVDASHASGDVTGVNYVGGLVGQNRSLLSVSNAATVTGIDFNARITNSHAIGNVMGEEYVGGLVGINVSEVINTGSTLESSSSAAGISSSYAVGLVGGDVQVGGLVGANRNSLEGESSNTTSEAAITVSYAVGNTLSTGSLVGGLVGANDGLIDNSYAIGNVSGDENIGGLVGLNDGEIARAYSTGFVDGSLSVGGLVGGGSGLVTNSFWNADNSGLSISAGGTGLSAEQMMQAANFSSWGNAINNTGEGDVSWRIYEGLTTPLLRAFMADLVLSNTTVMYNGSLQTGEDVPTNGNRSGTTARGIDAGTYVSYSDQQGYNIFGGSLIIDPIPLTAISLNGMRVYDGTVDLDASIFNLLGVLDGESLTLTGTGFMDDRHVGEGKIVNLGTLALGDCSEVACTGSAMNYTFSGGTHTVTITPKALSQSGLSVASSKVYDGTRNAVVLGSASFASQDVGSGDANDGIAYNVDTVSISGTLVGTYNDKDVVDATTVSFSGMSLTGIDANNYSLLAHADAAATITQKSLTQSGLSVANSKVYDSTTDAVVLGSVSLQRIAANLADAADGAAIVGDEVGLVGTAIGAYNDKDVADATRVAFSGVSLSGADSSNYSLEAHADAAASITQKSLTQSGLSVASSKVYDGTTDAVVIGNVSLQTVAANLANANDGAVIVGDDVSLVGTVMGAYNDKDVVDAMRVTISGLSLNGADVNNYSFAAPVLLASITPKALSQSGLSVASSKVYDGTRNAVVLGSASFASQDVGLGDANDGIAYNGDTVSISGTLVGTYNDKDVVDATTVSFSGMNLIGANAGNYNLLAHANAAATITPADAVVTAGSGTRYYNGLTRSITSFSASGLKNGESSSVLTGVSAFGSGVEIGTYPVVASGADGNYHLTFIDGLLTIEQGAPAAFLSVIGASLNSLSKADETAAVLTDDSAADAANAADEKVKLPDNRMTSLRVSVKD